MADLNLILLGPPGAGKGTQAARLQDDFHLPYVSTGDLLRDAVATGTDLGREAKRYMDAGDLVPDEVITGVIADWLRGGAADEGFLLDGFPRTIPQAEALDEVLAGQDRAVTAVLLIDVPDEVVVQRISGRRVSAKTKRVYHVDFDPPKHEGRCDIDGSRLIQRDDDKPEKVKHRLAVYHEQTAPLVDYYERRGALRRFDGTRDPAEVHRHIRASLATLRLEDQL